MKTAWRVPGVEIRSASDLRIGPGLEPQNKRTGRIATANRKIPAVEVVIIGICEVKRINSLRTPEKIVAARAGFVSGSRKFGFRSWCGMRNLYHVGHP